jgi:galactose mutarotase-like enzyme
MIELKTGSLHVTIDLDLGATFRFLGRPGGPNVLATPDWEPPTTTPEGSFGSLGLDWIARYPAGWQLMFPNAGDACVVDGVTQSPHGDASLGRWLLVDRDASTAVLRWPAASGIEITRRVRLETATPTLVVTDTLVNRSSSAIRFVWGHHPAFAADAATIVDLPAGQVTAASALPDVGRSGTAPMPGTTAWPMSVDAAGRPIDLRTVPLSRTQEVFYVSNGAGWAAIRRPDAGIGVVMAWDVRVFPHVWLWRMVAGDGFPFHGRGRLVAVEPVSCWPADGLARAIERGQASTLGPGARLSTDLIMRLLAESDVPVTDVEIQRRDGRVLDVTVVGAR